MYISYTFISHLYTPGCIHDTCFTSKSPHSHSALCLVPLCHFRNRRSKGGQELIMQEAVHKAKLLAKCSSFHQAWFSSYTFLWSPTCLWNYWSVNDFWPISDLSLFTLGASPLKILFTFASFQASSQISRCLDVFPTTAMVHFCWFLVPSSMALVIGPTWRCTRNKRSKGSLPYFFSQLLTTCWYYVHFGFSCSQSSFISHHLITYKTCFRCPTWHRHIWVSWSWTHILQLSLRGASTTHLKLAIRCYISSHSRYISILSLRCELWGFADSSHSLMFQLYSVLACSAWFCFCDFTSVQRWSRLCSTFTLDRLMSYLVLAFVCFLCIFIGSFQAPAPTSIVFPDPLRSRSVHIQCASVPIYMTTCTTNTAGKFPKSFQQGMSKSRSCERNARYKLNCSENSLASSCPIQLSIWSSQIHVVFSLENTPPNY